jgi:hypothetical protein
VRADKAADKGTHYHVFYQRGFTWVEWTPPDGVTRRYRTGGEAHGYKTVNYEAVMARVAELEDDESITRIVVLEIKPIVNIKREQKP